MSGDGEKSEKWASCVQVGTHGGKDTSCECVSNTEIKLACGNILPIGCISGACFKGDGQMPMTNGFVGNTIVYTLRDTGCSGVVVRRDLVNGDQMMNYNELCTLLDGTILRVPVARVYIDTPYLTGTVAAMCMKEPIYDLVAGNVPGVRQPDDPDLDWWSRVYSDDCNTGALGENAATDEVNNCKIDKVEVVSSEDPSVTDIQDVAIQKVSSIDAKESGNDNYISVVLTRASAEKHSKPLKLGM